MASSWTAKLHYNIKLPGVHKWEKRWVSKGSMMVHCPRPHMPH